MRIERRNPRGFQASLTAKGPGGIHGLVKPLNFMSPILWLTVACGTAGAQVNRPLAPPNGVEPGQAARVSNAPAEVEASALNAVLKLGEEVVLGRYQVAVDRMNPLWKERTAKRMGGMKALEDQLANVADQMKAQGISIISFKPQGLPRSYEVGPGKKVDVVNGTEVESLIYTKWLVLVPTSTKFRMFRPGETKAIVIESIGYQVAVSEKGANDWTFIDGSGLTVNDLRGLFATLPQDLELPPLEKREAR